MSNAVTALNGATMEGGIAQIAEVGLQGMITLRGDLADAAMRQALGKIGKLAVASQREANVDGDTGVIWMSPDELLVLCPYGDVTTHVAAMQDALQGAHALAVDVSDARASFRVSGPAAREVMAKVCPVDLSAAAFQPGVIRRTRLSQVPAAFWMTDDDAFQIICFRSQARYVFDVLSVAAQPGSQVHAFT